MSRIEKHLLKIERKRKQNEEKKLRRDSRGQDLNGNNREIDEENNIEFDSNVTHACDDVQGVQAPKIKKKRKFKRKYLQPQPKRTRRRGQNLSFEQVLNNTELKSWNGVLKNISGHPTTETEEVLFTRGKQFAPVELDPPIIRMQKDFNRFF